MKFGSSGVFPRCALPKNSRRRIEIKVWQRFPRANEERSYSVVLREQVFVFLQSFIRSFYYSCHPNQLLTANSLMSIYDSRATFNSKSNHHRTRRRQHSVSLYATMPFSGVKFPSIHCDLRTAKTVIGTTK